jgi:Reverse transcriptase (RNA-dependent DNA polymerase)
MENYEKLSGRIGAGRVQTTNQPVGKCVRRRVRNYGGQREPHVSSYENRWGHDVLGPRHTSAEEFIKANVDKVSTHQKNGHWKVIDKRDLPKNEPVLDAVWSMKRKRRLLTNEIYKWKARLNLHEGQQEYGVNYWKTYTPVVTWAAIRLVLVLVLKHEWHTNQIDFVLAYPQTDM